MSSIFHYTCLHKVNIYWQSYIRLNFGGRMRRSLLIGSSPNQLQKEDFELFLGTHSAYLRIKIRPPSNAVRIYLALLEHYKEIRFSPCQTAFSFVQRINELHFCYLFYKHIPCNLWENLDLGIEIILEIGFLKEMLVKMPL